MLNAVLSSKSGRLGKEEEQNINWRELFRASEDLVTATIFERLSYLPGTTAWQIIFSAVGSRLRPYRIAEISSVEFWPMWPVQGRTQGVEPDIFFELSLGDPERRMQVIVEAKHGGQQFAGQLAAELEAWIEAIDAETIELPHQIVVLAIGGLHSTDMEAKLQEEFSRAIKDVDQGKLPDFLFLPIHWGNLARSISTHIPSTPHEKRLLNDMSAALELFGYHHISASRHLEQFLAHRRIDPDLANKLMALNSSSQEAFE